MKTLQDYKALIIANLDLLNISKNQIEIFAENGEIKPGSNKENELGLHYLDFEYRLTLEIEEMPAESLALLSLLTLQFVNNIYDRDELDEIRFEYETNDLEKSIDIEINFGVRDPVYLVPVDTGYSSPISMNGKMWGLGNGVLNVAESLAGLHVNN